MPIQNKNKIGKSDVLDGRRGARGRRLPGITKYKYKIKLIQIQIQNNTHKNLKQDQMA